MQAWRRRLGDSHSHFDVNIQLGMKVCPVHTQQHGVASTTASSLNKLLCGLQL
jgi:hypothetical protein